MKPSKQSKGANNGEGSAKLPKKTAGAPTKSQGKMGKPKTSKHSY